MNEGTDASCVSSVITMCDSYASTSLRLSATIKVNISLPGYHPFCTPAERHNATMITGLAKLCKRLCSLFWASWLAVRSQYLALPLHACSTSIRECVQLNLLIHTIRHLHIVFTITLSRGGMGYVLTPFFHSDCSSSRASLWLFFLENTLFNFATRPLAPLLVLSRLSID